MLFRKKRSPLPEAQGPETEADPPVIPPEVFGPLERLHKAGAQVLVRVGASEGYTTSVVGLGRDAFFLDTLSPPDGDRRVRAGTYLTAESLLAGVRYAFRARVLGKVEFVDELPAFRLAYPDEVTAAQRRQSPRLRTRGDVSASFLQPFPCDAPVVDLSEGGLALEYEADRGRLRTGTRVRELLLELGDQPVIPVQGRVVANLVIEVGGLSLPRRYRASLAFEDLSPAHREAVRSYLGGLPGFRVSA